jgi:hypothetical protein
MRKVFISEDAFEDLNEGFLFYEAQEFGLGDYFTSCLRADIESLKIIAGIHRQVEGFHRLLSRVFPHGIFYTLEQDRVLVWAVIDLRRDPEWIISRIKK